MKKVVFIITLMLNFLSSYSENITYNYKNIFQFQLPTSLEIEYDDNINSSCIQKKANQTVISKTFTNERVAWCQKGLNSPKSKDVFDTYCRVITFIDKCDPGEVPARYEDFAMDEETWEAFFDAAKEDCESTGQKIIKRLGFSKINFNGYPGVYICYLRSGWKNAPPVIVYKYTIFDGDKICHLIFSYRESEADLWSDIKNTIARTFSFDIDSVIEDNELSTNLNNVDVMETDSSSSSIIGVFAIIFVLILIFAYCYYKKEEKI